MVTYLAFVGLALLLTGQAIIKLFRRRFPHPTDLAIVSVAYYGIPLSLAGYFDWNFDHQAFLAPFAADKGLAEIDIRYVLLALVALRFGTWLGERMGPARFTRFGTSGTLAVERLRATFLVLLAIAPLGIYLFGINEFLSGYATDSSDLTGATGNALVYMIIALLGLSIAYAMILGQIRGRTPGLILIAASAVLIVAVLVIRAKRLEIIAAFIPVLVIFVSRRASLASLSWRVVGGGLVIAVLLIVSVLRVSDTFSVTQMIFLIFSEGLYAGHSMPGILERLLTDTLNYEYGVRYVTSLFGFVPRFLWEGKDDLVYAGNYVLEGVAPQGATSMLAEVVLQGGAVAVALSFSVYGWIFERIMLFEDVWDDALRSGLIPARVAAYLLAIGIFIPHFRDGIIPAIKLTIQSGVFLVFLFGVPLRGTVNGLVSQRPAGKSAKGDGLVPEA